MKGIIDVTFKTLSQYGYKYYTKKITNNGEQFKVLNDSNINDYITVQLSGRLTDYSNNYFKGVHLSGNITSSLNGSQCENVSFKLKMSVSHDDGWSYNGKGHDEFEERIFLDSGCNYAIATSKKLSSSAKSNSASYYYDISDVKGSIIVPKKIVE